MKKDSLKSSWVKRDTSTNRSLNSKERGFLMQMATKHHLPKDSLIKVVKKELEKPAPQAEIGEDPTVIHLSQKDYAFLLDVLENPPPPNEKLKEANRRYLEMFGGTANEA